MILDIGPRWHKSKEGTPTMGGFIFMSAAAVTLLGAVLWLCNRTDFGSFGVLLTGLAFGFVGFIDDYFKVVKKQNKGLSAKAKFLLQLIVAAAMLMALHFAGRGSTALWVPFFNVNVELSWAYYPFALLLIAGTVNAVNLTDGVDGLAGSVSVIATLAFCAMAILLKEWSLTLSAICLSGAMMGFLYYNLHPAKVFMGDTGSLFLGGFLCAAAFWLNVPLLLLPVCAVCYVEMFSVILQVLYFRKTGKRLFKMSPIHHHFELSGWSEMKIVVVAAGLTLAGAAVATAGLALHLF